MPAQQAQECLLGVHGVPSRQEAAKLQRLQRRFTSVVPSRQAPPRLPGLQRLHTWPHQKVRVHSQQNMIPTGCAAIPARRDKHWLPPRAIWVGPNAGGSKIGPLCGEFIHIQGRKTPSYSGPNLFYRMFGPTRIGAASWARWAYIARSGESTI